MMKHEFVGQDLIKIRLKTDSELMSVFITDRYGNTTLAELAKQGDYSPKGFKTLSFYINNPDIRGELAINIKAAHERERPSVFVEWVQVSQGQVAEVELPDMDADAFALTPYEMATMLAYTYTGSTPDAELLDAAAAGLNSDEDIRSQIERLLQTDRAQTHFASFVEQWFRSDEIAAVMKNAELFPDFTEEVKQAMALEAQQIFLNVMFNEDVPFSEFYDANYTFVNAALAEFYGIAGISGEQMQKVVDNERGGFLTSGAFLSTWSTDEESHMIKRAVRVRERAMCQHLPPFPSNIDLGALRELQAAKVEEVKALFGGNISDAHLYYVNTDLQACKSCHEHIINPLGIGMEDYDAVGRLRSEYLGTGIPVDFMGPSIDGKAKQSAKLYGVNDIFDSSEDKAIEFAGTKELGQVLAQQQVTQACFNEMAFRFVMATGPDEFDHDNKDSVIFTEDEKQDYVCAKQSMQAAMGAQQSMKEAFINIGLSDVVRFRKIRNRDQSVTAQ